LKQTKHYLKKKIYQLLLGEDYKYITNARFMKSGEIHQWMYDFYSISKLLKECNFKNPVKMSSSSSYINDWSIYQLDQSKQGPLKPDSLYVEAFK